MSAGSTGSTGGTGSTDATAPLLAVEGLGVRMGIQQILSDVSLRVPERGVITVLGANGVGKTTLMRTLSGVYRASAGRIVFAGEAIGHEKKSVAIEVTLQPRERTLTDEEIDKVSAAIVAAVSKATLQSFD